MSSKKPTFSVLSQNKRRKSEPEAGEEPEGEEPEGEEPEGEEPEGEEPEGEELEEPEEAAGVSDPTTQNPVPPSVVEPESPSQPKPRLRSRSRELTPLPPPASAKEKQLRELNEAIRVNISKKIIKVYSGVTKDLLQVSSVASETLVTTQSSMNTMLSSQEALKKITTLLSSLPAPLV